MYKLKITNRLTKRVIEKECKGTKEELKNYIEFWSSNGFVIEVLSE